MDVFLVVRTFDVNYAALAATATVVIDGGDPQPLTPAAQPGTFELELPATAAKLVVGAQMKGLWPVSQALALRPGPTPHLDWDGPQQVAARNLETHSRGSDQNVVVNLVLGQLRDGRKIVDDVLATTSGIEIPPRDRSPGPQWVREFGAPLLNDSGKGWDRLTQAPKHPTLDGRLFFAERETTPRLIACYVPARTYQTFQRGEQQPTALAPVPYHVFFHPSAHFMPRPYPTHLQYSFLVSRYLTHRVDARAGKQTKAMLCQHASSGKRPVFVFPVGSPVDYFGSLPKQASLLRTLQELSYFLQRMDGVPFPALSLGPCAVSAFSFGAEAINTMLANPFPAFDGGHLREIYGLDLHRPEPLVPEICDRLRAWFRRGADGRRLRVYTTNGQWSQKLTGLEAGMTTTKGAAGSIEEEGAQSTLLLTPPPFFYGMAKDVVVDPGHDDLDVVESYFDWVHHLMPALFMEHALKRSKFADP